jgi:galactonate dehydratase
MKITGLQTTLVHPGSGKNWLFVKLETDAGLHGWGEAYTQADRVRTLRVRGDRGAPPATGPLRRRP